MFKTSLSVLSIKSDGWPSSNGNVSSIERGFLSKNGSMET